MTLTEDSVFLYNSVNFNFGNSIIEIGCGQGTLLKNYGAKYPNKKFYGIDINTENFESHNVKIIKDNITNIKNLFPSHSFDIFISNPPYFKTGTGLPPAENKLKEKMDIDLKLHEIIDSIKYLLRPIGFFYFVFPTNRLYETLCTFDRENIKPYKIKFRHTKEGNSADICLFIGKNRKGKIEPEILFPHIKKGG